MWNDGILLIVIYASGDIFKVLNEKLPTFNVQQLEKSLAASPIHNIIL